MNTIDGIVIKASTGRYQVHTERGVVACRLRGNLKKRFELTTSGSRPQRVVRARGKAVTDPVAVGDRVRIDVNGGDEGVIREILPRRSEMARLARVSGSQRGEARQVIAANIDQIIVVFATAEPRPDFYRLDRFLAVAEASELDAIICINKLDIADDESLNTSLDTYRRIGYPVILTSVMTMEGLDELRSKLAGKVSVLCGPSGVGKSSILNALDPQLGLRVGDMGEVTHKGKHTTTSAELLPLRSIDANDADTPAGWVVDTPGLRQLDLWQVPNKMIASCFREFCPYLDQCRFGDCSHHHEPGCAIMQAVARGEIDERRYASYLSLSK